MTEITVANWNAEWAFGDMSLSLPRMSQAFEMVRQLDADVLMLPETARHDTQRLSLEQERIEEITSRMGTLGYQGVVSEYAARPGVRNDQLMSMWTRVGGEVQRLPLDTRWGLKVSIPESDTTIYGHHGTDLRHYVDERMRDAKVMLLDWQTVGGEMVSLADENAMAPKGPHSVLPRVLGRIGVPNMLRKALSMQESDFYNGGVKRLAGMVIRVCEMADDETLQFYADNGLVNADTLRQPTIGKGPLAFQIDHIHHSRGLIAPDGVTVHGDHGFPGGEHLSDHAAIKARIVHR